MPLLSGTIRSIAAITSSMPVTSPPGSVHGGSGQLGVAGLDERAGDVPGVLQLVAPADQRIR